jgi:cholesterol transport system auxiliary component
MLTLNGCISLLPESGPAPKLYTLSPSLAPYPTAHPLPLELIVEKPHARSLTDNAKIVFYENEGDGLGTYTFVRGRQWIERLPLLLHTQLIEGMEKANLFKAVSSPDVSTEADILLQFEVRNFEIAHSNKEAAAHICLAAKILHAEDRHILASHTFEKRQPAEGEKFTALMHALDKGWTATLIDLVNWTRDEAQNYLRAQVSAKKDARREVR